MNKLQTLLDKGRIVQLDRDVDEYHVWVRYWNTDFAGYWKGSTLKKAIEAAFYADVE